MSKELEQTELFVGNIQSNNTDITIDDNLILIGNITFNTTPTNGDVLTFTGGSWISAPYSSSDVSVEQINSSGATLNANVNVSFINVNGTCTLLSPSTDGFEKKIVKTVGGMSMTVNYNGGSDMATLTNVGDTKTLNYSASLGMWF